MALEVATNKLIIYLNSTIFAQVELLPRDVSIGRRPDVNDLVLSAGGVASRHAILHWDGELVTLIDLGSTEGTFTASGNRLPAQAGYPLSSGTSFLVGPFTLLYISTTSADETAAEPIVVSDLGISANPHKAEAHSIVHRLPSPGFLPQWAASDYLHDLPVIYQDNDFLGRMLLIFEALWEPLEQRQDHLHMYFDPRTAPVLCLEWIASWLDLGLVTQLPDWRRRKLIAEAYGLYSIRGTAYALERIIELCTGLTCEILNSAHEPFVFQVRISIPAGGDAQRDQIEKLINLHKPAFSRCDLQIVDS